MPSKSQQKVILGMVTSVIVMLLFVFYGYHWYPFPLPEMPTMRERLIFTLRCDFFTFLMLFIGIAVIAQQRLFDKNAIDGRTNVKKSIDINRRYVQNTLEQCTLLLPAHLVLASYLTTEEMVIIPVLVTWFIIARSAFWIGYHYDPPARAFGFAGTFYILIGTIVYDIYCIIFC